MIFSHDDGDADQTSSFCHVFSSNCLQSQFCFLDCEYQRPWVPTNPSPFPQELVPHSPQVIGALADEDLIHDEDPMHEDMDPTHEREGLTRLSWSETSLRGRDRDRPGTGRGALPGWGRFSSRCILLQHCALAVVTRNIYSSLFIFEIIILWMLHCKSEKTHKQVDTNTNILMVAEYSVKDHRKEIRNNEKISLCTIFIPIYVHF